MTLKIGNKIFEAGSKIGDLRLALDSVPEPKCSTEIPQDLTPDNTIIALQREVVALDIMHMPPTIGWTGTKNLVTCVYGRIYNEEQEVSFHVDSIVAPLDISAMISHFRRKDNLKVMLLGGVRGEISEAIVNYMLNALISAKETITITYQKLMMRNNAKEITNYVFIRDLIMRKSAVIYRRLFNESFDCSEMMAYPLSYFTNEEVIADALKTWANVNPDSLSIRLETLAKSFVVLNDYVNPKNLDVLEQHFKNISQIIKTKDDFYQSIKLLFTRTTYQELVLLYKDIIYDAELTHFAINIKTDAVHVIPVLFDTPYESYRVLYLHDKQHINDLRAKRYFLAYDQCQHVMPHLSSESIKEVNLFYKHLDHNRDLSLFFRDRGHGFFRALTVIRSQDPEMKLTGSPVLMHYCDKKRFNAAYVESADAEQSAVLMYLNSEMPKDAQFTAKIRQYPRHVVDAHLQCEDWAIAKDRQRMLANKGIEAHILKQDKGLVLCVPGINVDPSIKLRPADKPDSKSPWVW